MKRRFELSETVAASAMLVLCLSLALALFARPREVAPRELPSLRLPQLDVREVMVADAAAAKAAPTSKRVEALEGLLLRHGEAESIGPESQDRYDERKKALAAGYREVVAESSASTALRLRAKNVQRVEDALDLRLPQAEAKAVLGSLPRIFALEGVTRDGRLVASRFVVRTIAKARWNLLHGFPPTHALSKVELRSYFGWQSLHAERLSLPQRIKAVKGYIAAGGEDAHEALGTLFYRLGDYEMAAAAFSAAFAENGSLRLRNHLLAARAAAGRDDAEQ